MDIVQLLADNDKNKLKLLELIQTNSDKRIEISFLEEKTDISKFKLNKLLKTLKIDLMETLLLDNIFTLNRGVIQVNSFITDENILKLRQRYASESLVYQLFFYLLFSNKTINNFIATHYVSNSSLYIYKKKLSNLLKEEHLNIKGNVIEGDELKIRFVAYSILDDLNGVSYPFSEIQKNQSNQFVFWIEQLFQIRIRNSLRYKLSVFLSIAALRIKKNSYLKDFPSYFKVDTSSKEYAELVKKLIKDFCISRELAESEAAAIYIFLYINDILKKKEFIKFEDLKDHLQLLNSNYIEIIKKLTRDDSINTSFLNELIQDVQPIHERLLLVPDIHHRFSSVKNTQIFQDEYPLFNRVVRENISKVSSIIDLNEDEQSDLYTYYMLELVEKFPFNPTERPVYITLDFSYGKIYEEYVSEHLQHFLERKIVIEKVISSRTDVYISDFYFENLSCTSILWQKLPSKFNWPELITKIEKIILEKDKFFVSKIYKTKEIS